MRGRFITFEGPEGGGKSTQARLLCERLSRLGLRVVATREPGGTRTGEAIRDILQHDATDEDVCAEAEVLLFAASRAQLVRRVILPALESGVWVVSDRFADSTTIYQGIGRGFERDTILRINAFAVHDAMPDATLLLDVDVPLGFARLARRRNGSQALDRIEREGREFHERVRQGYLELAGQSPERFHVIDAAQDVDRVADAVWERVARYLPASCSVGQAGGEAAT